MDSPGEWYFDSSKQMLYIWTPDGRRPDEAGVEIAVREVGLDLSHRSYLTLVNLDVLLVGDTAIRIANSDDTADKSHGLMLQGLDVSWATSGMYLGQAPTKATPADSQIRTLTLQDSRIRSTFRLARETATPGKRAPPGPPPSAWMVET